MPEIPVEQSIAYEENKRTVRIIGQRHRVCIPSSRRNLRVYSLKYMIQHLPPEET